MVLKQVNLEATCVSNHTQVIHDQCNLVTLHLIGNLRRTGGVLAFEYEEVNHYFSDVFYSLTRTIRDKHRFTS